MKAKLKAWLKPIWSRAAPLRNALLLIRIYFYDYRRFRKHYATASAQKTGREELASWILQDKHRIEKGLSLASARPNFGQVVLTRLAKNLSLYRDKYDKDANYFWGVGAFSAFENFHQQKNVEIAPWFEALKQNFHAEDFQNPRAIEVGTRKHEVPLYDPTQFKAFFESRASVRDYDSARRVPEELLEDITQTAIKTPSVCNRQHWRVHIVSGGLKDKVLSLQNGNAGFGGEVPQVAILTSSLKAFSLPAERVQAYTDGGMFAMSFLLTAHAHGIATCPLNWAASLRQDIEIRKLNILADSEAVIMLIALGYARSDSVIANSPRKSAADILTFHS